MASESRQAVYARAREVGVSTRRIDACFEKMTEYAVRNHADEPSGWVEKLVWEHYFPGEPFPGKVATDNRSHANEPAGPSRLDRIFSNEATSFTRMMDESDDDKNTGRPWVHDKFSATLEHSDRMENRPSTRLSDYYPAVSGRLDSYKPPGSSLRTDRYRPKRDDDVRSTPSPSKRRLSHSDSENIPTGPATTRPQNKGPDQALRQIVISAGFEAKRYEAAQQLCQEQVKTKHSDKVLSSEWLKWKEESLIWRHFFYSKPFPFKEPSWVGPKSGYEGNSPARSPVKTSVSTTATAEVVDKRGTPGPTEYFTLEKRMEAMVKDLGGADLRRQFFQYLQRMRDKANHEHRDCDKSVRAYMADGLTWKKFFEEPFPGRKPLGGHTKGCLRRSNSTEDITPTRSRQPSMTVTNQTRPIVRLPPKQESATSGQTFKKESPELHPATSAPVPKPVEFRVAESPTTDRTFESASPQPLLPAAIQPVECLLIIQGCQISCSLEALKNISYSVVKDNKYELVGKALECEFIIHQRAQDNGLRLTAVPLKANDTPAADHGAGFLQAWVGEVLERGPIEMSSYWLDFCTANGVPQNLVEGIRNGFLVYDKETVTGDTSRGKSWAGSSETLACPEQQWEQYAEAFAASDIDRLVIEETTKAEGLLRMVCDEETGDVVTLGEYKKRSLCRFVGLAQSKEGTKKRKLQDDIERKEKRIKVEENIS